MNDDGAPDSVDDVFAKASRMSRAPATPVAAQQPAQASLDASLAAVANHARKEAAASRGRPSKAGRQAAASGDPSDAARAPKAPAPSAADADPDLRVNPIFAAAFTSAPAEIAALHDKPVDAADDPAQPVVAGAETAAGTVKPAAVPTEAVAVEQAPTRAPASAAAAVAGDTGSAPQRVEEASGVSVDAPARRRPRAGPTVADHARTWLVQAGAAIGAAAGAAATAGSSAGAAVTRASTRALAKAVPAVNKATARATANATAAMHSATAHARVGGIAAMRQATHARSSATTAFTRTAARARLGASAASATLQRLPRRALLGTAALLVLGLGVGFGLQRILDTRSTSAGTAQNAAPRAGVTVAPPPVSIIGSVGTAAAPVGDTASAATASDAASAVNPDTTVPTTAVADASAVPAAAPASTAATAADDRALLQAVTEPADAGNTALVAQLLAGPRATAVASDESNADGWLSSLLALSKQPRIAVVRYDALQAARRAPAAQRVPPLEVVAPLTLEPIYLVVRGDSPLEFVHEIRGKAINAGAAKSSRALTVDTLYRGLFDGPLPAHPLRAQPEAAALDSLLDGKLDVVVIVGAAARAGLVDARSAGGKAFKLLAFDPAQPMAQRALNSFLPVQVAAGSLGGFPLARTATVGMMSFVVTARQNGQPADDEHGRAIGRLADELCGARMAPQRGALAAQPRVDPAMQLYVGWPYSTAAQSVLNRCGFAPGAAASRNTAGTPPGSS